VFTNQIQRKETAMSTKPQRVELLEQGILKLVLTKSTDGTLNNKKDPQTGRVYNGRATSAKIFGPKGSGVTFYDDQQFRTGENSVYIEKLTDNPIEVFISQNFVKTTEQHGDGMFFGEEPGKYKWVLFKAVKRNWLQKWLDELDDVIPLNFDDIVSQAKSSGDPRVSFGGGVVGFLSKVTGPKSDNYRLDNCSSVQFGGEVLKAAK
jgi:hypothetical protein